MATRLSIIGSTGSIGTQTLEVVRSYPKHFEIETLTANSSWELLASQAIEFSVERVVIANDKYYGRLRDALKGRNIEVLCGVDAIEEVAASKTSDVVVVSVVGFAGLAPTISAIKASRRVALANKESLVVGGEIIMPLAKKYGVDIIPIDSEHSAIYQALCGESTPPKRILLTASGGSLRDVELQKLSEVTPQRVLCHPVWEMGARITVDSATMLNKGFEVIEAAHLFGVTPQQIQVVIHRQSIIHSAVEFADNAIIAQMSYPDMRLAIQYALFDGERMAINGFQSFDPFTTNSLTFEKPDPERYPCLGLAFDAINAGGLMPTVLNGAGEVATEAFLQGKIRFTQIAEVIESALSKSLGGTITSLSDIYETDSDARVYSSEIIKQL
ncbi:MAG: 1-deoxy-D-xylulose-5-phosphate reductoisomerase [Rikenellaceae bacterium]